MISLTITCHDSYTTGNTGKRPVSVMLSDINPFDVEDSIADILEGIDAPETLHRLWLNKGDITAEQWAIIDNIMECE